MSANSFVNISTTIRAPSSIYGNLLNKAGVQTTPQLARGYLAGSAIEASNRNLAHVCDFKFIFDFSFSLGDLLLPSVAFAQAIKNAKLAAAAKVRSFLSLMVGKLRKVIDAIIAVLGLDPSGKISIAISLAKDVVRKINRIIKQIAQVIEDILVWVFVAQQVKQLLDWILSLPAEIKQLLQDCVKNFTNSIKQVADSIASIPDQVVNETSSAFKAVADDLTKTSVDTLKTLKKDLSTSDASLPPTVMDALNNPSDKTANNLMSYIISTTPTANQISANTQSKPSPRNTP